MLKIVHIACVFVCWYACILVCMWHVCMASVFCVCLCVNVCVRACVCVGPSSMCSPQDGPLAWVNMNVFDYAGELQKGKHTLYAWAIGDQHELHDQARFIVGVISWILCKLERIRRNMESIVSISLVEHVCVCVCLQKFKLGSNLRGVGSLSYIKTLWKMLPKGLA